MAEERTYTEKELEEMANLLLADEEPAPEVKPKKKAAAKGKKEPAPEQPVKTPEERLNELVEKGKKNGKLTAKELECLEDMNLDSEVSEFGDFSEESCEAPWHGLTVFEPEVEHVSEEVYGGGLVLDAVEEVDESAFLCTAAADGLGAQVGIAEEVDRFHQVGEGVCGWVGNAFRGVAVRWLVCGSV